MEGTDFLLKWNNYHNNLNSIFTQWWKDGVFVDCTLVVDCHQINCHRFVLSACSPFFETLLTNHNSHPHPLIIINDLSYEAVKSLLEFMYRGEVHVSKEMLSAVVKAAKSLRVKGISDSRDIAEFSTQQLSQAEKQPPNPDPTRHHSPFPTTYMANQYSAALACARNFGLLKPTTATNCNKAPVHRTPLQPIKKRRRLDEPLPPSPPISVEESNIDHSMASPHLINPENVKEERDDEASENELQIDESASASTSSPSPRLSSTPGEIGLDMENRDFAERLESAQSLASLATHGATFQLLQHHNLAQMSNNNSLLVNGNFAIKKVKQEAKCNARRYTNEQLQQAVEAVIKHAMAPAKAISTFNIPRRTFFRKLSNERKALGISSSRDNTSDSYLSRSSSPAIENGRSLIASTDITTLKNWQETANTINNIKASILNTINKDQSYEFATAQYMKNLSERQKENEDINTDSRAASDSVSVSNSADKPLVEKNGGFDN